MSLRAGCTASLLYFTTSACLNSLLPAPLSCPPRHPPPPQAVASRENSRSAKKHQRRVDEVLELELEVDSRTDSFNSEEGFGSPVRNRCA